MATVTELTPAPVSIPLTNQNGRLNADSQRRKRLQALESRIKGFADEMLDYGLAIGNTLSPGLIPAKSTVACRNAFARPSVNRLTSGS